MRVSVASCFFFIGEEIVEHSLPYRRFTFMLRFMLQYYFLFHIFVFIIILCTHQDRYWWRMPTCLLKTSQLSYFIFSRIIVVLIVGTLIRIITPVYLCLHLKCTGNYVHGFYLPISHFILYLVKFLIFSNISVSFHTIVCSCISVDDLARQYFLVHNNPIRSSRLD